MENPAFEVVQRQEPDCWNHWEIYIYLCSKSTLAQLWTKYVSLPHTDVRPADNYP